MSCRRSRSTMSDDRKRALYGEVIRCPAACSSISSTWRHRARSCMSSSPRSARPPGDDPSNKLRTGRDPAPMAARDSSATTPCGLPLEVASTLLSGQAEVVALRPGSSPVTTFGSARVRRRAPEPAAARSLPGSLRGSPVPRYDVTASRWGGWVRSRRWCRRSEQADVEALHQTVVERVEGTLLVEERGHAQVRHVDDDLDEGSFLEGA